MAGVKDLCSRIVARLLRSHHDCIDAIAQPKVEGGEGMYHMPGREDFIEITRLLPGPQQTSLLETWDAGEWHLAIEFLGDSLADVHIPLAGLQRAQLFRLAEQYEVEDRIASSLRWCPDPDDQVWSSVEATPRAQAIAAELMIEIAPNHPLMGKVLRPWLACVACDDVLVMVDSTPAAIYPQRHTFAVVHPTCGRRPEPAPWPTADLFVDALPALDRLEACR